VVKIEPRRAPYFVEVTNLFLLLRPIGLALRARLRARNGAIFMIAQPPRLGKGFCSTLQRPFPSFPRRGGAAAPGWLTKLRSFLLDAAKPPLFNSVRFANICAVVARLDKPPRSLRGHPSLKRSDCVGCQATKSGLHRVLVRSMAFKIVSNLRIQAVIATFLALPAAMSF